MKIEKINDNQIRCTLDGSDLAARHISLHELAYGTQKAQRLFNDMVDFAGQHFHFDIEDMPLVIEAIPLSHDSIMLILTKVSYPDELDARFSTFSDMPDDLDLFYPEDDNYMEEIPLGRDIVNAGEILSVDESGDKDNRIQNNEPAVTADPSKFIRLFESNTLDALISLGHVLKGYYHADNALYHPRKNCYYLVLTIGQHTARQFNKICNVSSEYATMRRMNGGMEQYFAEHARPVLEHYALQTLSEIPKTPAVL